MKKCTVCEDSALTLRSREVGYLVSLINWKSLVQVQPPPQIVFRFYFFIKFFNLFIDDVGIDNSVYPLLYLAQINISLW